MLYTIQSIGSPPLPWISPPLRSVWAPVGGQAANGPGVSTRAENMGRRFFSAWRRKPWASFLQFMISLRSAPAKVFPKTKVRPKSRWDLGFYPIQWEIIQLWSDHWSIFWGFRMVVFPGSNTRALNCSGFGRWDLGGSLVVIVVMVMAAISMMLMVVGIAMAAYRWWWWWWMRPSDCHASTAG